MSALISTRRGTTEPNTPVPSPWRLGITTVPEGLNPLRRSHCVTLRSAAEMVTVAAAPAGSPDRSASTTVEVESAMRCLSPNWAGKVADVSVAEKERPSRSRGLWGE